jgi:hypothetical protein
MKLDPEHYRCPDHQADVTDQVKDALPEDEDLPRVTYGRRPARGPFRVIVTCPGADGSGQHELTCRGTWSR